MVPRKSTPYLHVVIPNAVDMILVAVPDRVRSGAGFLRQKRTVAHFPAQINQHFSVITVAQHHNLRTAFVVPNVRPEGAVVQAYLIPHIECLVGDDSPVFGNLFGIASGQNDIIQLLHGEPFLLAVRLAVCIREQAVVSVRIALNDAPDHVVQNRNRLAELLHVAGIQRCRKVLCRIFVHHNAVQAQVVLILHDIVIVVRLREIVLCVRKSHDLRRILPLDIIHKRDCDRGKDDHAGKHDQNATAQFPGRGAPGRRSVFPLPIRRKRRIILVHTVHTGILLWRDRTGLPGNDPISCFSITYFPPHCKRGHPVYYKIFVNLLFPVVTA